jgi:iron complex outermembrane receptor protein
MQSKVLWLLAVGLGALLLATTAQAAGTGRVTGTVVKSDGSPVADADVELVDLHWRVRVDDEGRFAFDSVPVGTHVLVVDSLRDGSVARKVVVAEGETLTLELGTELRVHSEAIVVSASPGAQRMLEVASAADVLAGEELRRLAQPTIGATLANQVGVHQTGFGIGASRPILRGLGGDRVRMLEGGVGTGDISETSPDHAVTAEALTAERIEILRGPATLLYGSNAIGGVVNVIDESIPSHLPHSPIAGTIDLGAGSVADERDASAVLRGGAGRWAWSLRGMRLETDDFSIPGFAETEEEHAEHGEEGDEEENPHGVLSNSDVTSTQVGAGLTWFLGERGESGFFGVSVSGFDSDYGVPGGHEHGEEEGHEEEGGEEHEPGEEEGDVRIAMERLRYDLEGAWTRPFGMFAAVKARLGVTDYEHDEIEPSGEIGTHFENDAWEGRLEFVQRQEGALTGALGLQAGSRDFSAMGEEAVVPPNNTDNLDLFLFEEVDLESSKLQFGARWANRDIRVDDPAMPDRDFSAVSGSIGWVWTPGESAIGISLARSVKFPAAEELYSNGPHAATRTFEIGDPTLGEETSLGFDLFYRLDVERLRAEVTFFVNDFDDFIYPAFTGEVEDGFDVVQFSHQDAEFRGAELDLTWELIHAEETHPHLDLRLMGDFVEAELADGSTVPRTPPLRLGAGLDYRTSRWFASAEVRWTDDQTDVAENETPTEGSTVVNAAVGYRLLGKSTIYDLLLRANNLTDEEVRLHTSYLKDVAPQPGRDFNLSLRISF